MSDPNALRQLALRLGFAVETAAQFNHATTKKNRRGFARHMLAELRAMQAEVERLHRQSWDDDAARSDATDPSVVNS